MKSIKTIKDPKAFELLGDETRRRVIYLLRVKEMTVSQIASDLGLTAQAIYHHIRKMKSAGLVEVFREERVGHFIETYYRATAEIFQFSHGESMGKQSYEEIVKGSLNNLAKLGMMTPPDPDVISKSAKIMKQMKECCGKDDWADKVGGMPDVGFFVKQVMIDFAHLISVDDEQYEESVRLQKEMRDLLRSRCPPPAKPKRKKP